MDDGRETEPVADMLADRSASTTLPWLARPDEPGQGRTVSLKTVLLVAVAAALAIVVALIAAAG